MLTPNQLDHFNQQGYLVIQDFIKPQQRHALMARAQQLIEDFEPPIKRSVFTTDEQERTSDDYFLSSGNQTRFFFEEKAIDSDGNFTVAKQQSINKIGHGQHEHDPVYKATVTALDFNNIGQQLGLNKPRAVQSMHIFKQPGIGGEVGLHQDSTFLYTQPKSCIGFWMALEDATVDNGCLQAMAGGHTIPLKQRFKRAANGGTEFETLDTSPWPEQPLTMLEVPAGTLIILHGQLPHYSAANTSNHSRQAFTLHLVDQACDYPDDNWLVIGDESPT
ncbi:MAG: phytanoyl-CoA dioxygenase family protein [Oceanospirillaceae bacterium]|jgi:phytanoyl-CoA hydroxylase|nr:phytanoyl-CoA dioxygenase family protein [Oceanospirillaceae bacterium]MBT4442191.1 phytanoyl-CoA dioxygenase family protein [Oceanospirillaceae bacterium]MBT6076760.1 phytanoyl-CoA dioxygenase family protein [Oceanospirillaceae bacterium]MBT7329494.1 phytanoyl-CoA dioxygenase family protein [Oceanospirillaceae bacterium]